MFKLADKYWNVEVDGFDAVFSASQIESSDDAVAAYMACMDYVQAQGQDALLINELMHELHVSFKDTLNLRAMVAQEIGQGIRVTMPGACPFMKFPEILKGEIEEKLSCISDDIALNFRSSWLYSHDKCGDGYQYDKLEDPIVVVSSLSKEALEMASGILQNMGGHVQPV